MIGTVRRGGKCSGSGVSRWWEFNKREAQLAFEINDFAGIGSLKDMAGKLKDVAPDEKRESEQEDRNGKQAEVNRYE